MENLKKIVVDDLVTDVEAVIEQELRKYTNHKYFLISEKAKKNLPPDLERVDLVSSILWQDKKGIFHTCWMEFLIYGEIRADEVFVRGCNWDHGGRNNYSLETIVTNVMKSVTKDVVTIKTVR